MGINTSVQQFVERLNELNALKSDCSLKRLQAVRREKKKDESILSTEINQSI
jgi:hypothetical protein